MYSAYRSDCHFVDLAILLSFNLSNISARDAMYFSISVSQDRLCICVRTYLGQTMYFSQERLRISVRTDYVFQLVQYKVCVFQYSTKYYFSQDKVWLLLQDRVCISVRTEYVFQDRVCVSVKTEYVFQLGKRLYFSQENVCISVRTQYVFSQDRLFISLSVITGNLCQLGQSLYFDLNLMYIQCLIIDF